MKTIRFSTILAILFATMIATAAIAGPVRVGHIQAELVSEVESIKPGQPFTIGLHLVMDPEWHVYWLNAGDAGIPPKLILDLPTGFTAGEIQWPYPDRFEVPPLVSFGYHHELLLPVTITPPSNLPSGTVVTLNAKAEWLVCKVACIPGGTDLSLELPVNTEAARLNVDWADAFNETRGHLPLISDEWRFSARVEDRNIVIEITAPEWHTDTLEEIHFFPLELNVLDYSYEQTLTRTATGYELWQKRSQYNLDVPQELTGVMYTSNGWRGPGSEKALSVEIPIGEEATSGPAAAATTDSSGIGVWEALLFAFLGGIILNLMPCVLPVLSLKILGFVQQARERRNVALNHGLIFAAGVVVSFWALAGALLILQAGGEQLGWGFQLQSPTFLILLSSFIFLFGLNLLGLFEVGTSLTGIGGVAVGKTGYSGSFIAGITATVVATPCTAPFMGSALGYSLSQPPVVSLAIFTSLAIGMASPYILLSASPGLVRFVPTPGRWMETLKQIMGFLLIGTVVWLAWVLGVQGGVTAVVTLLATLLLVAFGGWIFGRWGTLSASKPTRIVAYVFAAVFVLGGIGFGLTSVDVISGGGDRVTRTSSDGLAWQPFSPDRVSEALKAGAPVFIDFTAAWCLSCQVNERVALETTEVVARFEELGVQAFKADWTSRDEIITRALAKFGRNSVPLYVLYSKGSPGKPIILPEILTPGIVLQALEKLEG